MIHVPWTIKPPCGTPLDMSHPLKQGLVACWPMNEDAGKTAKDIASGYDGIIDTEVTQQTTIIGSTLKFPGNTTNYVRCGVAKKTQITTGEFTILAIAKLVNNSTLQSIAGNGQLASVYGYGLCFSTNTAVFQYRNGATAASVTSSALTNNAYYHITGTRSGGVSKLYVNGNLASSDSTAITVGTYTEAFSIGVRTASGSGVAYPFTSNIAFVCVYNRALSAQEIKSLYENPYQIFQPITLYNPFMIAAYNYWLKVGGTWEQALDMFVKINGGWQKMNDFKVKVGGTWI